MARRKASVENRLNDSPWSRTEPREEDPEVPILETSEESRAKRTYYLPTPTIMLLDEIQLGEFKRTGKKPDLSELVKDAIQLLAEAKRAS